jgi:ribosome-binding protein aMBF1 (putative translation factor)
MSEMHEVYVGCKICGRQMLTNGSPLVRRTCDACNAEQRRKYNRKNDARRKAKRHAAKAKMAPPRLSSAARSLRAPPGWLSTR